MKKFFDQQTSHRRDGSRETEPPVPPKRKKKISEDVGEYVRFEEINVNIETEQTSTAEETETTETTTKFTVEEQVVDVEWEDIK